MTYFYVALGGAIGSVARAWVAVQMARATGPAFPWGTILINVTGSFVIAFFGVLTAANARLPLSAEARTFVMVGLCGGFTTFSSFSLQTLDLAREGRLVPALANVALSVVLCLAAVGAGYYAGAALNGGVRAAFITPSENATATLLAAIDDPETAAQALANDKRDEARG